MPRHEGPGTAVEAGGEANRCPRASAPQLAQVCGCTFLAACGVAGVLSSLAQLLCEHFADARAAMSTAAAIFLGGAVLGFVLPRYVIRARLAAAATAARQRTAPFADPGFVSLASAIVLFLLATVWAAAWGIGGNWEAWRGFAYARSMLPDAVLRLLIYMPGAVILLVAGGVTAVLVLALRGWWRVLYGPEYSAGALWGIVLIGAAMSWVQSGALPTISGAVLSLVALYAAALVAALRPGRNRIGAPNFTTRPRLTGVGRLRWTALASIAVLAAALALGLSLQLPEIGTVARGTAERITLCLSGALLGGSAVRWWLVRSRAPNRTRPGMLPALGLGILAFALHSVVLIVDASLCMLSGSAIALGAATSLISARMRGAHASPLRVLSGMGAAGCGAAALMFALASGVAGGNADRSVLQAQEVGDLPDWFSECGLRVLTVTPDSGEYCAWEADRQGPGWDVVVVTGTVRRNSSSIGRWDTLLRRCRAALKRGGRLIVASSEPAAVAALVRGGEGEVWQVSGHAIGANPMLAVGADVPQWFDYHATAGGTQFAVKRLPAGGSPVMDGECP